VPGAVRTRLALLGARLPPGAAKLADRASVVRHLWRVGEAERLRGETIGLGARLAARVESWRRHRLAAPWNPLRALGPRLHPVVHVGDEDARSPRAGRGAGAAAEGRQAGARARRSASMARATALAKTLGGVYHAERLWLFLPAHDGLPRSSTRSKRDERAAGRDRRARAPGSSAAAGAAGLRPADDRARARARGGARRTSPSLPSP
jgi:hypothetical protein